MHLFPVVVLLAVASQAMPTNEPPASLRVPSGRPDGAYSTHNQSIPQELHEHLPGVLEHEHQANTSRPGNGLSPKVQARYSDSDLIACGCVDLNHRDCDEAVKDLNAQ
ncbi:hypothetical protein PG994_000999 [Apiospora phragmitis]|uniref:Secreted protein n=1 Tax=Apiospora phragmitis TaxID=2905665 RepID=A0ABR1WR61_9PEZI